MRFLKSPYLLLTVLLCMIFCTAIVSAHESPHDTSVTVHINDNGFDPELVEIQVGTEVVFENAGNEEHWPAGDDHPSHTLYDGTSLDEHCASEHNLSFDACKGLLKGESWSFVFTKEGVYEYHDHLWPQLNGRIIVNSPEERQAPEDNFVSRFISSIRQAVSWILHIFTGEDKAPDLQSADTKSDFYTDLKIRFEKMVVDSDPHEAIHALEEESSHDSRVLALCHDVLHVIGHAAYDKYGSFKAAVSYQSDFCNSGYIHGLFEAYFKQAKDPLTGLSEQCTDYAVGKRDFDLWQCYHGIGHGFMYLTGGDLDESLKLCSSGLSGESAVSSCHNGVYMEVFNMEILAKEKKFVNPDDPFNTCATRDVAKDDCYLYVATYLSQALGHDFTSIFNDCIENAENDFKHTCVAGVGLEAIKRNMTNPREVFALCGKAGAYQEACVSGVVSMYLNQKGNISAGKALCKEAPAAYHEACYGSVENKEPFFKYHEK